MTRVDNFDWADRTAFLAARDRAEMAWDNRMQPSEKDCDECDGEGWRENYTQQGWHRCGKCQGGTIYFESCVRCRQDEHHCPCAVSDFMEGQQL